MSKFEIESNYWGDCYSEVAFGEICKQRMYAREMGLWRDYGDKDGDLNLQGKSILDIGGGPMSMLLRCYNVKGTVVDPIDWPASVKRRYDNYGIDLIQAGGEDFLFFPYQPVLFDEVWIYNCLQHTMDPVKVLENAKKLGKRIRIFEWLWTGCDECHPHSLTPELLLGVLPKGDYTIKWYTEFQNTCNALAGVFNVEPPEINWLEIE